MPFDKRWRGRRVTRTKRRGDQILVRLQNPPGYPKPNTWLALSPDARFALAGTDDQEL